MKLDEERLNSRSFEMIFAVLSSSKNALSIPVFSIKQADYTKVLDIIFERYFLEPT